MMDLVTASTARDLTLRYADSRGQELAFSLAGRRKCTLGRSPSCELALPDERISRVHASIEVVEDQCLLRDEWSSNGTFLNGLRLNSGAAFALRDGDVIELGSLRLVFGAAARAPSEGEPRTATFSVDEVTHDGYVNLDLAERRELQVEVQRAFEGVPRLEGVERCLAVARRLLAAHVAIFFAPDAKGQLRPIATSPVNAAERGLAALAEQAFARKDARLVRGLARIDGPASGDTCVQPQESAAVTPIQRRSATHGILAVERTGAKVLDRSDLALLAVVADRIALALSVQGKSVDDTQPGYES